MTNCKDAGRAAMRRAAFVCLLVALGQTALAAPPSGSRATKAITEAARAGKFLFLFCWKDNDAATRSAYEQFQAGIQQLGEAVQSASVQVTDPAEQPVVARFGLDRAPMPLVLALAPNGAVTRAFPPPLASVDWRQAIVSPGMARCLKALQGRKLVVLCVGNRRMQQLPAALYGAQAFGADPRFAAATEIVVVDPDDQTEAQLLHDLQVDPRSAQPTTVLLAPPGRTVARFTGPVTKEQLAAKLTAAQSSCCPGGSCGPNGCGPGGCSQAQQRSVRR